MTGTLRASVIVATRNRGRILELTLPRLLEQAPAEHSEVIVVDDASSDDTPQVLARLRRPGLTELRTARRAGAAAARNRGVEAAQGERLVFVDDDAFVARDFLRQHLLAHAGATNLIVAGPIIEVTEVPPPLDSGAGNRRGWHRNPFPSGNVSASRDLIRQAGGFDEEFSEYGWEDAEIWLRLRACGGRRGFAWAAPILHYKSPATRADFPARLRLERMRGAMGDIFYAKHPNWGVGFVTKQLGVLRGLDAALDFGLGLEARVERSLATGWTPKSALLRWLLITHAEISAGARRRLAAAPVAAGRDR